VVGLGHIGRAIAYRVSEVDQDLVKRNSAWYAAAASRVHSCCNGAI
jgi:hypothetical protein